MQPVPTAGIAAAWASVQADRTAQALGVAMLKQQAATDAALVRLLETSATPAKPPGQGVLVDRRA